MQWNYSITSNLSIKWNVFARGTFIIACYWTWIFILVRLKKIHLHIVFYNINYFSFLKNDYKVSASGPRMYLMNMEDCKDKVRPSSVVAFISDIGQSQYLDANLTMSHSIGHCTSVKILYWGDLRSFIGG